jgi:FkbM family methyltransferase
MAMRDQFLGFLYSKPHLRKLGRGVKRTRRLAFERLGSDRYSHPSLDDLDRKLVNYLPEREGVFVEAGACDGYLASNTYWLERFRGWTGVLIEPVPELADRARKERPRSQVFQCALVPTNYEDAYVTMRYGAVMSVVLDSWADVDREQEHAREGARVHHDETFQLRVPARSLSDVLSEAGLTDIDLMTLDVEGFEARALLGLDLAKHCPRFLLVELLHEDRERPEIDSILSARYQYEARLSSHDHLYRRTGDSGKRTARSVP